VIGIVLAGHGGFCEGLLDAAQMIMGPQEHLAVVPLGPAENLDEYREKLQRARDEVDSGDGVLVFVDLFGGSPSNVAAYLLGPSTEVVTGVSLPMLLEVLSARTSSLTDVVNTAVATAQLGTIRLADRIGAGGGS
jgi:PTS system mannose-specific IIA component